MIENRCEVNMDLLSEYKELYHKSIEHSDRLSNKINTTMTQLAAISTGNVFIWREYFTTSINTTYLLLCFTSFLALITTLFLFYRAYSGYTYAYFPTKDMSVKVQQVKNIAKNSQVKSCEVDTRINGMFTRTYLKCAIINTTENMIKTKRHKILSLFLVISFLSLAIAFAFNIAVINNIHILT
jgi:hypothetical protein